MTATPSLDTTLDGTPLDVPVFDLFGPLPSGTTVLEASAGTGKTYTIAALATRYVAEGAADLADLLIVTFGKAATSELRDRVRERLVATEAALRGPHPRASTDELVRHLALVDSDEIAERCGRLRRALAQFDAATIATTHGFCQQLLATLGIATDVDPDSILLPDLTDLVDEVVDDVYVRLYAEVGTPLLTAKDARQLGHDAVSDPHARLEPSTAPPGTLGQAKFEFAQAVAEEVLRRKRQRRVLDYDDLLTLVRDTLTDPVHGPVAVDRIRSRYRIVLVDEFQDTDPVQWQILHQAFHGHSTLVLIGDPKQAIYQFRGGDVVTYLTALAEADTTATLACNWRSDEGLLSGLGFLLDGLALGDPRIVVRPIEAAQPEARHRGFGPPVRLRHVRAAAFGTGADRRPPAVGPVRDLIVADVVADVIGQLQAGQLRETPGDAWRPVRPGDIAVLARTNDEVMAVRDGLVAAGVPAVFSALESVFASSAARDWLTLLVALEEPSHAGRTATAALTSFVGWDAARLTTATDRDREQLSDQVRAWAKLLTRRGVAALLEDAGSGGLAQRLLHLEGGERTWTDIRHVGQLLHDVAVREGLGVVALTDWLRRRVEDAKAKRDYADERSRRLETDAAAVQVVTIHSSKGLEFPLVYVPFAWDRYEWDEDRVLKFHDDAGERVLHIGGAGSVGYDDGRDSYLAENRGESLRLLYVALTRARSQVVIWWARTGRNTAKGPLTRVLLGGAAPGQEPPPSIRIPSDADVAAVLDGISARSDGTVGIEPVLASPQPVRWTRPTSGQAALSVASFTRELDQTWGRASYTRLTAAAHATPLPGGTVSEPELTGVVDEPDTPRTPTTATGLPDASSAPHAATAEDAARAVPSPLTDLPGGASFGTLVHTVLETIDTSTYAAASGDDTNVRLEGLRREVLTRCRAAGADRIPGVTAAALADGLVAVLTTPLGPAAGHVSLAGIGPRDRLSELEFELPLAGGDSPRTGSTIRDISDLLEQHLPAGDPFLPYVQQLRAAPFADSKLRGYLTGSLDSVLRLTGPDRTVRYLVVDFKTNRLAPADQPVTAWDYRPTAMVAEMLAADYVLQLLLYLVALHRYLRWRQPGYDPDVHLAGGLYLFVRGMCGPTTPTLAGTPTGVLAWRPPTPLIVALSALLDAPQTGPAQ